MTDFNSRGEIEEFLLTYTTYDIDFLFKTKSYGQIANMCRNIKKAMRTYPKEIIDFLKIHPEVNCPYSDEDIYAMNYNELAELRRKYSIKTTKKKVTSTAPAESLSQKGRQAISEVPTGQLCLSLMGNTEESEQEVQFLSDEEIEQMYPGGDLSEEDLFKLGIKRYNSSGYISTYSKDERANELIDKILSYNININGISITEEYLCSLTENELEVLEKITRSFSKESIKRLKK